MKKLLIHQEDKIKLREKVEQAKKKGEKGQERITKQNIEIIITIIIKAIIIIAHDNKNKFGFFVTQI